VSTPATVIVPAHNEEAVLVRCLSTLLAGAAPGEFAVIVVSNGSGDRTVARAREFARRHPVDVVDLPAPSKIAAVRAGFARAEAGVRVVVDADVLLDTDALRELVAALDSEPRPRAGCPRLAVRTVESSALVRAYYRTWTRLPYVRSGMIGSGVFAVNPAGAARLGTFPDVLNDDEWVRRSFAPHERVITPDTFTMIAPRTLRALLARTARAVIGNRELDRDHPGGGNGLGDLVTSVRRREVTVPNALAYITVTALARGLAQWRLLTGTTRRWSTDRTSRRISEA
jgi:glycosyltransferase involved in cell wall biosynthesis